MTPYGVLEWWVWFPSLDVHEKDGTIVFAMSPKEAAEVGLRGYDREAARGVTDEAEVFVRRRDKHNVIGERYRFKVRGEVVARYTASMAP